MITLLYKEIEDVLNSFINGIERDNDAVKNGIKYDYNNGLAEGSVNKIKLHHHKNARKNFLAFLYFI